VWNIKRRGRRLCGTVAGEKMIGGICVGGTHPLISIEIISFVSCFMIIFVIEIVLQKITRFISSEFVISNNAMTDIKQPIVE
jgi:hypothetical protein